MLIILTSVLTWGATPPKMVPEKPPVKLDENGDPIPEKTEEELEKEEELRFEEENKKRVEEGLEPIVKEIIDDDYDWEDMPEEEENAEKVEEVKKEEPVEGEDAIPVKPIKWVYKEFEIPNGEEGEEPIKIKRRGKKKVIIKEIKVF